MLGSPWVVRRKNNKEQEAAALSVEIISSHALNSKINKPSRRAAMLVMRNSVTTSIAAMSPVTDTTICSGWKTPDSTNGVWVYFPNEKSEEHA